MSYTCTLLYVSYISIKTWKKLKPHTHTQENINRQIHNHRESLTQLPNWQNKEAMNKIINKLDITDTQRTVHQSEERILCKYTIKNYTKIDHNALNYTEHVLCPQWN